MLRAVRRWCVDAAMVGKVCVFTLAGSVAVSSLSKVTPSSPCTDSWHVTDGSQFRAARVSEQQCWRQTASRFRATFLFRDRRRLCLGWPFHALGVALTVFTLQHAADYTGVNAEGPLKNCVSP